MLKIIHLIEISVIVMQNKKQNIEINEIDDAKSLITIESGSIIE